MFTSSKWEDWASVVLGIWLLASPWTLGFVDLKAATATALVVGAVLVLEELVNAGMHDTGDEWIDIVAGVWLVFSPFLLGFTGNAAATANMLAAGFINVLLAVLAMSHFNEKFGRWWHDHRTGH